MFCMRCGYLIEDGATVCSKCGTPVNGVEPIGAVTANVETTVSNTGTMVPNPEVTVTSEVSAGYSAMPNGAPAPKKKKFNVVALVLGIVAAFAVLILIVVALNFSAIDNAVRRTFSSPESYYKYVEKKTVKEWSSTIAKWYDAYMFADADDMRIKSQITVEINEAGQSMLSMARLFAGVDATWFESGTITMDRARKDGIVSFEGSIFLNEQELLSGNIISDTLNEIIYFQLPELTETYMGVDLAELEDEDAQDDMQEFRGQVAMEEQMIKAMPDQKTVEELTNKYLSLILDCVDDVTKEKDTLEVGGVSQDVLVLTVTLDDDAIQDIWEVVFKEIKNDKEIQKIVVDLANIVNPEMDEDEAYKKFLDELESQSEEFEKYFFEYVEKTLTMKVYVDKQGGICGRSIEWVEEVSKHDDEWTNIFTISMLMPQKGNQFGYELEIFEDMASGYGEDTKIKISGSGTRRGDTIDGDFNISYDGARMLKLTLEDFDTKKIKNGQMDGTIEIRLSDTFGTLFGFAEGMDVFEEMKMVFVGEAEEKEEKITFDFFVGDESLITITAASQIENKVNITMPSEDNTIMIQDEDDLQEWIDEVDWDEVESQLEESDLPYSVIYMIEDLIDELKYMDLDYMVPDIGLYNNIM